VQKVEGRRKKKFTAKGEFRVLGCGRRAIAACSLIDCGTFPVGPLFKKKNLPSFFWCYEEGPGILEEWVYNTSIF
jgi:hypothetical protein